MDLEQSLSDRMTQFLDAYVDSIRLFKQQLSKLEYYYEARKPSLRVLSSSQLSVRSFPSFDDQWKKDSAANGLRYSSAPFLKID